MPIALNFSIFFRFEAEAFYRAQLERYASLARSSLLSSHYAAATASSNPAAALSALYQDPLALQQQFALNNVASNMTSVNSANSEAAVTSYSNDTSNTISMSKPPVNDNKVKFLENMVYMYAQG